MWYKHGEQVDSADEDEPADDDNNCELVPLSHYGLESYYTSLLNALKNGNSYDSGEISYNGYGHTGVGTFQILATKHIVEEAVDADGKAPGNHLTDKADSPAEVYTIQVIYKPNTEGASEKYDHTTSGGSAGKVTTPNNSEDQVDSENEHRISVIKKGLKVEKVDESGNKIENPATFILCRPALTGESVTPVDGLTGSYHVVDTLVTTGGSDSLDTTLQELRKLASGQSYYLVETDNPDGFLKLDSPIPVNVNVTPGEQTKPYEATQGITNLINVGLPEASIVVDGEDAEAGEHTADTFVIKVTNKVASIDITIHRVDDKNRPLYDAVFKLANGLAVVSVASEGTGVIVEPKVAGQTVTINDNTFTIPEGGVTIRNIKTSEDTYSIVEVNPPAGYVLRNNTPVTFKVTAGKIADEQHIEGVTYAPETRDFTIPNEPGAALPSTGGPGTNSFYIIGCMLIMIAGAGIVTKKRKAA